MQRRSIGYAIALATTILMLAPAHAGGDDRDKSKDKDIDRPMIVVDANGKTVGRLGGGAQGAFVAVQMKGQLLAIDLIETTSQTEYRPKYDTFNFKTSTLYSHNSDCTGAIYIVPKQATGMKQTAAVRLGLFGPVWLYTFEGQSQRGPIILSSFDNSGCHVGGVGSSDWTPWNGVAPVNITSMFKEPLHVE